MIDGLRRVMRGESRIDFIGRSKVWLTVSIVLLAFSLLGLGARKLHLGVEFEGGTSLTVPLRTAATVADVENRLEDLQLGDAEIQVQAQAGERRLLVRAPRIDPDRLPEVRQRLAEVAGVPSVNEVNTEDVGPSWGRQVSNKALRGLFAFLLLVTLYISMRFEPKMAISAIAAMFHDLIAAVGIYAWVGFEVTPATVIAFLTLMGFSLYDTVVVFDRVRENAPTLTGGKQTYSAMVNESINEVLVRSINTSLSSVLPVAGLLFVGVLLFEAVTLKDLALAMFVGTLVSTYSSIFVAAPLLAWLKEREPRYASLRSKLAGARPAVATTAPAPTPLPADEPAVEAEPSPVVPRAPLPAGRGPAAPVRQRGRKRGRGRRR